MKLSKILIIAIAALAFTGAGIFVFFNVKDDPGTKKSLKIEVPQQEASKKEAYLYFTDKSNQALKAEKHLVFFSTNTRKYAKTLIELLIKGPDTTKLLMSAIPENTRLLSLYIQDNNTAVLDFSNEIRENHPGGSQAEILTIYSIVNTLTLNINEIKKVKILINGKEAETLAGHIALKFPLKENLTIIK